MATVQIPYRRVAPAVETQGRLGSIELAGAEAGQYRALASVGGAIRRHGERVRAREDRYAEANAQAEFIVGMGQWEIEDLSRQDLHEPDTNFEGETGFVSGPQRYQLQSQQLMERIGKTLNARVRSAFGGWAQGRAAVGTVAYTERLGRRQEQYHLNEVYGHIDAMAPNRDFTAMRDYLGSVIDLIPEDKRKDVSEYAKEQVMRYAIEDDPQGALDALNAEPDMFAEKRTWQQMRNMAESTKQYHETQANKEAERRQLTNGRDIYANLMTYEATGGQQGKLYSPGELAFAYMDGAITKTMYDAGLSIVSEPDVATEAQKYEAHKQAGDLVTSYRQGALSETEARQGLDTLAPVLGPTKSATFIDRMNAAELSMKERLRSDGQSLIGEVLSTVVRTEDRVPKEGRAGEMLDAYLDQYEDDKPIRRADVMREALALATSVRDEDKVEVEKATVSPPTGFEDIWSQFTEEQKRKLSGYTEAQLRAFLKAYRAKPGPLEVNVNEIPSSSFN